jgi:carbamoyl-phosphate synthase small subunit
VTRAGTAPVADGGNAGATEAMLVLEDGTAFRGAAYGADGETFGEMVFNTGMTGYQETLTDPSYCGQIVAMTAPHIGNTGVNDDDPESRRIWVSGYVIREPARIYSSWRAARGLETELRDQGITGIAITGTRALTRHLRERGAMRAGISTREKDPAKLLQRLLDSPPMAGADLVRAVSVTEPYVVSPPAGTPVRFRVAAVDLGIKAATPRSMARLGCEVTVLPATATAEQILASGPDGAFFSNGPGDPAALGYAVEAMRGVLASGTPLFGICLGSQVMGRALGLNTYKLRFGHRGVNQPVQDLRTGRVQITSHNHGFAVAMPGGPGPAAAGSAGDGSVAGGSAPVGSAAGGSAAGGLVAGGSAAAGSATGGSAAGSSRGARFDTAFGPAEVTHVNLNDGVVEGLRLLDAPAFSVQYHPEAAPGTHDAAGLFAEFCTLMEQAQ